MSDFLPRWRGRSPFIVCAVVAAIAAPGCTPEGAGTVDVKGTDSIRAKLEKGAKPVDPAKDRDAGGIKFRNKKGGD